MKVLFLDIDGVLNSKRFFETWEIARPVGVDHLDADAVSILNRIVKQTGVKVVVSSTWRTIFNREQLQGLLRQRGFQGSIFGTTPSFSSVRGREIKEWLRCFPEVEHFVILDDADDMEDLVPWLVQTEWEFGLKEDHVPRIHEVLEKTWLPPLRAYDLD